MAAAFALAIISGIFILFVILQSLRALPNYAGAAAAIFISAGKSRKRQLFPYKYVYGSRFQCSPALPAPAGRQSFFGPTAAVTGNSVA